MSFRNHMTHLFNTLTRKLGPTILFIFSFPLIIIEFYFFVPYFNILILEHESKVLLCLEIGPSHAKATRETINATVLLFFSILSEVVVRALSSIQHGTWLIAITCSIINSEQWTLEIKKKKKNYERKETERVCVFERESADFDIFFFCEWFDGFDGWV